MTDFQRVEIVLDALLLRFKRGEIDYKQYNEIVEWELNRLKEKRMLNRQKENEDDKVRR